MVFITMGTGLGAGLILNGQLYSGTNDLAGETGHIRLEASGPLGYGKAGSFEGFCSGAGIAAQARAAAEHALQAGKGPLYCPRVEDLPYITTERVAEAAHQGDPQALEIFTRAGRMLGRGLAVLVDLLNPQRIVVGSIYTRQRDLLEPAMRSSLQSEALPLALSVCQVVPAELGESIGDYAALAVADSIIAD
jgi:glucokinase